MGTFRYAWGGAVALSLAACTDPLLVTNPNNPDRGRVFGNAADLEQLLIRLGPEPLTDLFDGERLFQLSRGRSMAVKPFIMDNAVVVGVGNIYATEALFAAGIDPRREAKGISRARYLKLAIEIKRILAHAIERGGTTLRDFIGGDGQPGREAPSVRGSRTVPADAE